ncbi:S1 RNA-binding domain-containing protein [Micromonospora halotolerans]|uniref:S1 RNA-binding domain-containing protein n=1 Tax=Micromonospora halotolerans TaxID=709879 RepID=A0ABY9ZWF2_9ACTN|nr:S1 RNA-binding domain-containing protein [Micromonospora halotolerans]WNM39355.1 S1 RNA-binding domain-containing protein [Micromonospora halotolerans]
MEVLSGPVVKVVPFGVFVRIAPGIAGLLHESVLTWKPVMGEMVTVTIAEVDGPRRQVRLELVVSTCRVGPLDTPRPW